MLSSCCDYAWVVLVSIRGSTLHAKGHKGQFELSFLCLGYILILRMEIHMEPIGKEEPSYYRVIFCGTW